MKDVIKRAVKTFIQAFFGVLVPEICIVLSGAELPASLEGWKMVVVPLICSALAAGISAAWNTIAVKGAKNEGQS